MAKYLQGERSNYPRSWLGLRANAGTAAGLVGQKQVHLLHVCGRALLLQAQEKTHCWGQNSPVDPSLITETVAISPVPKKNAWLLLVSAGVREHVSAPVAGIRIHEFGGWYRASHQLCGVRLSSHIAHKVLVLLSMSLSLLVFDQILDGHW